MPCNFITMAKTYQQINERIKNGEAVVLTAEEVSQLALTMSPEEIADKVDVVTTGTFGAMCSSGAFINFGHSDPPIRMERIELNGVGVSGGLAAVDTYIGATDCNPANPEYGGAHIIEDFINGKDILLEAWGKGTDCYPRRHIRTYINRDTVNEAYLYNPRNAYQNYNVATNTSDRTIHTYMGTLLPKMKNASYSTSGELSPLLNDPECRTIGLGTRIFLAGAEGYVAWNGTQFNTSKETNEYGIPTSNARTNTGDWSAATNTGNRSAATNTGNWSAATNTGDWSAATNTGKDGVAVSWGRRGKARGEKGCYLVLAEYDDSNNLVCAKMEKVDGERIKENTFYTLKNGEFAVAEEQGAEK